MISTTSFAKPVVPKTSGEYRRLKKSLRNSTAGYGSALATSYFITQGAEMGVSATLGGLASYAYISLLEDHVDNIENSPFQKQFLAPISAAAFEMAWNNAPFAFDFDYGATFVGFLAYKFALTTVLYEMVREMLISDSSSSYDTTEKEYNDLSDWGEQHGEIDITGDAPILEPDEQPVEANVG